jgi:CheY-like chemotaxis protein
MVGAAQRSGQPYGLVLIDAGMPGMTGIELARKIRGRPSLAAVALIMLTSSGHERDGARKAGIDGFVTKPVRPRRLRAEIARIRFGVEPGGGAPPIAAPAAGPPERGRVLVAEDNAVNQLVAVRLLEKRGFVVDVASNGRDALDRHELVPYDAIFMDCQMPELDGYAATAEIRRREGSARHTPIIAMTASTMLGDRERCLLAGMDHYMGKPLRAAALDEVISRALPTR